MVRFKKEVVITLLVLIIVSLACGSSSDGVSVEEPSGSDEEIVSEPEEKATKEVGTARSNPAPVGSAITADDMKFEILGSTRPADEIIMSGNTFNTEPEEGQEYILIEMRIECMEDSDDTCNIYKSNFKVIGDEGITYDAEWFVSGVEGLLESEEFYGGAVVSGSLPFIVKETDSELVFVYDPFLGDKFYMSVK
jgi:hypothetical protein